MNNYCIGEDSDLSVDEVSHGDDSEQSTETEGEQQEEKKDDDEFNVGKKESRAILAWRNVITALFVGICLFLAVGSWFLAKDEEQNQMNQDYESLVKSIENGSDYHIDKIKESLRSLAETITTVAIESKQSFPFFVDNFFEIPGHRARLQSSLASIFFTPFVSPEQIERWNNFSVSNQEWVAISSEILGEDMHGHESRRLNVNTFTPYMFDFGDDGERHPVSSVTVHAPIWLVSPPPEGDDGPVNFDISAYSYYLDALGPAVTVKDVVFSAAILGKENDLAFSMLDDEHAKHLTIMHYVHCLVMVPVYDGWNKHTSRLVGAVAALLPFDKYLGDLIPSNFDASGITLVLRNTCNQTFTFTTVDDSVKFVGEGDLHEASFENTRLTISLIEGYAHENFKLCMYSIDLYKSTQFEEEHNSMLKIILPIVVALIFIFVATIFFEYDAFIEKRNKRFFDTAKRFHDIVVSQFPTSVRDRLFKNDENKVAPKVEHSLKGFLDGRNESEDVITDAPLADLFPETTIMFADLAGFTAWSSMREPAQVFILLETLYSAFDAIAKQRRIFKVETIGDCYVAVAGLPDPRKDHAVAMARFARDCINATYSLTKKLEVKLGPDTGDLRMRVGLHSGPVVAGVLRGERSRFQLFGDTMNTASRMESTGCPGRIQCTQETADLLLAAGKGSWMVARENKVQAKGKGELQTYWLRVGKDASSDSGSQQRKNSFAASSGSDGPSNHESTQRTLLLASEKTSRLIEWNIDVLLRLLQQIESRRRAQSSNAPESSGPDESQFRRESDQTVLDEVQEVIALPKFDPQVAERQAKLENITISVEIQEQLRDYVTNIAAMYRDNHFHNFEHASHVTMSVVKLMSRIIAPADLPEKLIGNNSQASAGALHDHTYGITSDPLTQFACVYSALIHDVDHSGVPNSTLVKERKKIASFYKFKSIAEQNSVDLAWELLMDEKFTELRSMIYRTDSELKRFRQLVVNSVMATDIVDKELKALRNARWETAFSKSELHAVNKTAVDRKATIVIEHLIQASDVAHTMQHWHVYRKWNERFFLECYTAYLEGRADKDPADSWYEGEIGFFDYYIIPLAKKLQECGVFGVSSHEYLDYAQKNRKEWDARGKEIVAEMVSRARGIHDSGNGSATRTNIAPTQEVDESAWRDEPQTKKSGMTSNSRTRRGSITVDSERTGYGMQESNHSSSYFV